MTAYYNEIDPYAADWLRNLIAAGHIAPGVVDERSILDVRPADLDGFDQCHFFAGIGGWSLALRLAGWRDDRSAWTGSTPCQPFSDAGRGTGMADERHLWPAFYGLIRVCRPPVVWGEQVASSAVVGGARKVAEPAWLDVVFSDLEAAHYACGAADIPAASVGAPIPRSRLWWVAQALECTDSFGWHRWEDAASADHNGRQTSIGSQDHNGFHAASTPWIHIDWLRDKYGDSRPIKPGLFPLAPRLPGRVDQLRGAGNAIVPQVGAAFIEAVMGSLAAQVLP